MVKNRNRGADGRFTKGHSGNPKGRPPNEHPMPARMDGKLITERSDGWANVLTSVGTALDRRQQTTFSPDVVDYATAVDLQRGDDIASTAVEKLPDAALREGFDLMIQSEDDNIDRVKELQERIEKRWAELGVKEAVRRTARFERAYGGGAIMIGAQDGQNLDMPLDLGRVRSVDFLTPLEARELSPAWMYADPFQPKFGEVAIWRASPVSPGVARDGMQPHTTFEIHETRLAVFPGVRVSRDFQTQNNGWGDSILTRIWRVLRDFNQIWDAAGIIASDFAQSIFKIEGLAQIIAQDQAQVFRDRMKALNEARSVLRAVVLDTSEEFERKATPMTGLPELLDRFESRVAAATGMPVTVLFGRSPAGLNSTGEGDLKNWENTIADYQEQRAVPAYTTITAALLAESGASPETWSIEARPLRQQSAQEEATTRKTVAETDSIYIREGVLMPEEAAKSRFGGDGYSAETMIDFEAREALEALEDEVEARAQEIANAQQPPSNAETEPPGESVEETEDDRQDRTDTVEKRGERYVVLSEDRRVLGTHDTREAALAQLRAIEAAKAARG